MTQEPVTLDSSAKKGDTPSLRQVWVVAVPPTALVEEWTVGSEYR